MGDNSIMTRTSQMKLKQIKTKAGTNESEKKPTDDQRSSTLLPATAIERKNQTN
jgi:hypothetical protein